MATAQASRTLDLQDRATVGAHHTDTMIYWLARAARELREGAEPPRKQVHVAAALSIDQSTVYRFEQGESWPRQTDAVVAAYAEDLDIDDAREIWELALRMWKEHGEAPKLNELLERSLDPRPASAEAARQRRELNRLQREERPGQDPPRRTGGRRR